MSQSKAEFFRLLKKSRLLTSAQRVEAKRLCQGLKDDAAARELVRNNLLTSWQAEQLLRGRTRFFVGKYKLLKFRGRGAMGIVFKAQHPDLDRLVAVKLLSNSLLGNARSVSRFLREIRSAAVLNHPNIVVAYDADQFGDTYCLVMEYVSGRSLKAIFLERGALPAEWCVECARQTALALDHVHRRGLVHRDVKPSNLIVTRRPTDDRLQVKLLDVGLARFVSEAEQDAALTRDGQIVGTGDYMAPEQVAKAREADIRADIYGLGATLYQLIGGKAPLAGETLLQTYMNRLQNDPPLLSTLAPDVPRGLDAVVAKMLKREPNERYQTPAEVAADLAAVLAGATSESAPRVADPLPSASVAELFWAPVEAGEEADEPALSEFSEPGDSIADGLIAGAASSSGTASSSDAGGDTSTGDTAADGSLNDFLKMINESASSSTLEVGRLTKPKSAPIRKITGQASRAVKHLVGKLSRKKGHKAAEAPKQAARKKSRRSKAKPRLDSPS
jgi:eukaryotic-like serine/threonine-protein kinase